MSATNRKTALVTGAARGMGRAMTLGLVEAGVRVVAFDVAAAELEALAQTAPGDIEACAGDVTSRDDCERAVAAALARWGGVDILVNNAGVGMSFIKPDNLQNPIRFWDVPVDRWQKLMDINLRGPFLMARFAAPHLIEAGWGRIINVTTSLDTMYRRAYTPYGSSKAALEAASASWAADLAGTGVTVNVLIPGGAVDTQFFDAGAPLTRDALIRPEAMVPPLRWLVSPAADRVTGRRFVAAQWDPAKGGEGNVEAASAPAAWPGIGAKSQWADPKLAPSAVS
jgi:NAD(P)-dependent dehydrogenase (short-subunit alcohol dehydrogenase family)